MGLNVGEIFIVVSLIAVIFFVGRIGDIGEMVGKLRRKAVGPERDPAADAIDVSPPASRGAAEPHADSLAGPMEDAEVIDPPK